jgi:hypothetical protein
MDLPTNHIHNANQPAPSMRSRINGNLKPQTNLKAKRHAPPRSNFREFQYPQMS